MTRKNIAMKNVMRNGPTNDRMMKIFSLFTFYNCLDFFNERWNIQKRIDSIIKIQLPSSGHSLDLSTII